MPLLRRAPVTALLAFLLAGAVLACGPTTSTDDGGNHWQSDGGQADMMWSSEASIDQNQADAACHEQTFVPERVGDPDIIVLMDMSSSMAEGPDGGTSTKYETTSQAVTSVISQLETDGAPIWWGLLFFPTDGNCGVDAATLISPAAGNASSISGAITGASPNGNTPAHLAVQAGADWYGSHDDGRGHYLLIATDGQPNCDPNEPVIPKTCQPANPVNCTSTEICQPVPIIGGMCVPANGGVAVEAITAAAAAGVKTYVVGIDIDGTNDTLNMMAEKGGTARAGSTKYYPVSDQASTVSALENIATQIISCTFALNFTPGDLQYISVSVGGATIPHDQTNGWDIDSASQTLTFYGTACQALQTNPDTVNIVVACPPIS